MPRKSVPQSAPAEIRAPQWIRPVIVALAGIVLLGLFTAAISDTDFWWHLKTGEYIAGTRSLPTPDPFAYTTPGARPAYPGEELTRRFNLTHEWLVQLLLYLVYRALGFGGIVFCRALVLTFFCGIVGVVAYHRCHGFYRSLAAALAAALTVSPFAADRPFLATFLFSAVTLMLLEWNPRAWVLLLPAVMLFWANCHGGFILGWALMGVWCAEAIFNRLRRGPAQGDLRLWIVSGISVLMSGLNPNGFHVVEVLANYRKSSLTSTLYEWKPPAWWPPSAFSLLLAIAFCSLLLGRRKARAADWLLFALAAGAAATAGRNTFLVGLAAPILIASYLPYRKIVSPRLGLACIPLLLAGLVIEIAHGQSFQFRTDDWQFPQGAAEFMARHRLKDRMFNTYELGGYLIWKMWPLQRVFIDGRALSESVFSDYSRIVENAQDQGQASSQELLDRYGVDLIVMNGFEYASGNLYWLASSLADPEQSKWKLVYSDAQALIFMRNPPKDVRPLNSLDALDGLESECSYHIRHDPRFPGCAGALAQLFSQAEDLHRERRWLGIYLEHAKDPQAMELYQRLLTAGN